MTTSSIKTVPPAAGVHPWWYAKVIGIGAIVMGGLVVASNLTSALGPWIWIGTVAAVSAVAFLIYQSFARERPSKLVPLGLPKSYSRRLNDASIIIGRTPCSDISLPLPTVSGHHCRVFLVGRNWYVEDLASSNGTYVNDRRIKKKRLQIGDKISVGEFEFIVE